MRNMIKLIKNIEKGDINMENIRMLFSFFSLRSPGFVTRLQGKPCFLPYSCLHSQAGKHPNPSQRRI